MINGNERPFTDLEAETSFARISHRLERLYNPYVDFSRVAQTADRLADEILALDRIDPM